MFKVGNVVRVNEPDPFEMVSWRDENGRLCAPPPSVDMTVMGCEDGKFTAQWFEGSTLKTDTFSVRDFHRVRE